MSIDDLETSLNPRLSVPNFETYLRNSKKKLAKKVERNLTLILMLVTEVLICKN